MTQMPEMVGLLNGLGGLASMTVGIATSAIGVHTLGAVGTMSEVPGLGGSFNAAMLTLTVIVGAVTFTGSVVAFLKLAEKGLTGAPILLPARHALNLGGLVAALVLSALAVWAVPGLAA